MKGGGNEVAGDGNDTQPRDDWESEGGEGPGVTEAKQKERETRAAKARERTCASREGSNFITEKLKETQEEINELFEVWDPVDKLCPTGKERTWGVLLRNIFLPIYPALIIFTIIYFALGRVMYYLLMFWGLVYLFPPFGKESVIPLAMIGSHEKIDLFFIPQSFEPVPAWLIIMIVVLVDVSVAFFIIINFEPVKKIPLLGKYIGKIESMGERNFRRNPWVENLVFVGIVALVVVPFQGSGGLTASIIGRIVGMNKTKLLMAVSAGALIGGILISLFAKTFLALVEQSCLLGVIVLVIFVVIAAVVICRQRKRMRDPES